MAATILGQPVGKVGLGIMSMTWGQTLPYDQAFHSIRTAVDAGINVINSATFYGPPENPAASLKLLNAFFEANPSYVDKVIVCVKGALIYSQHKLSGEIDFLRNDVQELQKALGDKKKLDIYVIARQPQDVTTEQLMTNLVTLQNEGHFRGIGLSEVNAQTLRRAAAVHHVSVVENELSLFHLEKPVRDVVDACTELGTVFTAYSPLGRGILTKRYKTYDDLPPDDLRRRFPRFQGENFKKNLELGDKVEQLAKAKGYTTAQFGIAYILRLSPQIVALQGSGNAERILENYGAVNVKLTDEDVKAIDEILDSFVIAGDRYPEAAQGGLMKQNGNERVAWCIFERVMVPI